MTNKLIQFLLLLVSAIGVCSVAAYLPPYSYLIDCGSSTSTSLTNRTFYADDFYSAVLLSPTGSLTVTATNSTVPHDNSTLLLTARIFPATSSYTFPVQVAGRNLIRLHFFPFTSSSSSANFYNLSEARFSVSAQNVTLLRNFQLVDNDSVVLKEYSFDVVTTGRITLTFSPNPGSFAFINALEVFSLPVGIIPAEAATIDGNKKTVLIGARALETTARVNMGNAIVHPRNDSLWRRWDSDAAFRSHQAVSFVKNLTVVNYSRSTTNDALAAPLEYAAADTAPPLVYGSVSMLDSESNPNLNANLTWIFKVDSEFQYLVRFHLCEIIKTATGTIQFNVYLNSKFAYQNLNLDSIGFGVPFYLDVITRPSEQGEITVSVGPLVDPTLYPMAFLNGLEIMKISNSKGSLYASDDANSKEKQSRRKLIIAVVVVALVLVAILVSSLLLLRVCKRRRRKLASVGHGHGPRLSEEDNLTFSSSKMGYRFPLVAIEEATDKFSESLVIGVGGFGKVYKGVLRDGTKVAVKRGNPQSRQGLNEFQTEIEMLSQFRHRHLVSLIGYCDERNEMIIIYEFMENGTLKDHLYGSEHPVLSWKQRVEICIGAAKGLHYLHTGSAKAIIHRDVKSANILLDEKLMAKVADFGLSKAGPELNETHVSTAIKGSFGYLDPEYLTRQQLSEKSDVYSFGVVMLEVLTGRSVIDPSRPREEVNLVEWGMKWQKRGKLHELVDPRVEGQMKEESLLKFVGIADKCLTEQGVLRPPIGDVLWNLELALQLDKEEEEEEEEEEERLNRWLGGGRRTQSGTISEQSMVSMGDLDGVSMSKVFAQMIEEEE